MTLPPLSSETIHASCVSIDGGGVLLVGRSGSGKSDLALRLIDRGAFLVSDDYSFVRRANDRLIASAPATIAGRIEVRGIGIIGMPGVLEAPVRLLVSLDEHYERMPDATLPTRTLCGIAIPVVNLSPFEASAPFKVELALREFGLNLARS